MGIGRWKPFRKVLKQAGMNMSQIDLVELMSAFASQSLGRYPCAGTRSRDRKHHGALIALSIESAVAPVATTIQLVNDGMKRLNKKYGIVTACVGGGQGIGYH